MDTIFQHIIIPIFMFISILIVVPYIWFDRSFRFFKAAIGGLFVMMICIYLQVVLVAENLEKWVRHEGEMTQMRVSTEGLLNKMVESKQGEIQMLPEAEQ